MYEYKEKNYAKSIYITSITIGKINNSIKSWHKRTSAWCVRLGSIDRFKTNRSKFNKKN